MFYPGMPMQQQPGLNEIYASQIQEDRVKNLVAQTSPDNQLLEIQMRIKGYLKNNMTGDWEKVESDAPEPSKLLVARYISYLSSLLNDNTRFTNLSSGEINSLMKTIIEWLVDDLDANAEDYKLSQEYTERTRIGHILLNTTFMVLKRSQNGMESRRIFNAVNLSETFSNQPQKKGGFMEALKFWK